MGKAYGQSGQMGAITIGTIGPLKCTRIKLVKTYNNADTTVTDDGWGKLCPVYRDWRVEVEMPSRSADDSQLILSSFDDDAFPKNVEDVEIPDITFVLPNGLTYTGSGMLDGDCSTDDTAKDAVRLSFTIKGSGELVCGGSSTGSH